MGAWGEPPGIYIGAHINKSMIGGPIWGETPRIGGSSPLLEHVEGGGGFSKTVKAAACQHLLSVGRRRIITTVDQTAIDDRVEENLLTIEWQNHLSSVCIGQRL